MRFLQLKFLLPLIVGVLPIPVAYACSLSPNFGFLLAPPWVTNLTADCRTEIDLGLFYLYIFIVLVAGGPLMFALMKKLRIRSAKILAASFSIMIALSFVAVENFRATYNRLTEEEYLARTADPDPLDDITVELDHCFRHPIRTTIFYCSVDEFSFSESYWTLETGHRQCEQGLPIDPLPIDPQSHTNPSKLLRLGEVYFVLGSDSFPFPNYHHWGQCEYDITIHWIETGENHFGQFTFQLSEGRYDFTLTRPASGKPIAGMIYDNEEHRMFYLVTKMVY